MVGDAVVDGGVQDLWDGTLDMPILYSEIGTQPSNAVHTGTTTNGTVKTTIDGCMDWASSAVWMNSGGYANSVNTNWTDASPAISTACWDNFSIYCIEDVDNSLADITPNSFSPDYPVQVAVSSRQSSSAMLISGMSSGASTTLSVSATGGNPKFKVNGGAEVTSASITNGDSIIFVMDAPSTDNSSHKMTITAGGMTSYWRIWTGDSTGTVTKRIFVTSTTYSGQFAGVGGADTACQTRASAGALGGAWKAILSGWDEADWAINRVGYNWTTLRLIDNTTNVVLAGNLWKTSSLSLLNPISKTELGAILSTTSVATNSNTKGFPSYVGGSLACLNWTNGNTTGLTYRFGVSGVTSSGWVDNSDGWDCRNGSMYLYCIEQ